MSRKDNILMNMNSEPLKDTSQRDRLYKIADRTWNIAGWIWSAVIIVFLVSFAAGLAAASDPKNNFNVIVLSWLSKSNPDHVQEFYRITVLSVLVLFIAITLLSVILRQLLKPPSSKNVLEELLEKEAEAMREREAVQKANDEEGFMHYLRSIKEMNQNISPKGLAQHSRTLLFTDVPLDEVFVNLHVMPDRPIYDIPAEQQRQLKKMQQRTDLSSQEREDYIQRLRFTWYFQSRYEQAQAQHEIPIDEVLRKFFPRNPVAIILGTPGSGKTTFLRWVAYHLADTLLSSDPSSLTNGSAPTWIPILIQTNDYADRLAKEPVTLRQFLIIQLSEIHPNALARVLDALEHGRCLVLFDGLDEGFSPSVRRHVTGSIHSFIIDHSVEDPKTQRVNNFIITSRIADYAPEVFAKYSHYTLLDLDEQHIERFLAKWCSAIGRYLIPSAQGTQHPAERGRNEVAIKQQEHLYAILETHPGLKDLAISPLALMLMAFMQMNGRNVLQHRFDLYQAVTRTLLDTWNRESGRKMLSGEELSLVEDLLGRFADRLQNDDGLLTTYDIEIITRQAMADFYRLQVHEIKEYNIAQLVETLRRSSGLFAEVGDDLFCFANQTFQDFFAALYLLHRSREERRQLAVKHFLSSKWSEPLLLILMYKSAHSSRDEQREINEILQAILDTPESSPIVQRNLLFVMSSIVNGGLLVIDKALRERIHSSAERMAQQQSARITAEQRNLIATLLHQIDRQTTDDNSHPAAKTDLS
jgi:NACHT domain-containing protein